MKIHKTQRERRSLISYVNDEGKDLWGHGILWPSTCSSIHCVCKQATKALIRLRERAVLSGPSLPTYDLKPFPNDNILYV